MWAMPIVAVKPSGQFVAALVGLARAIARNAMAYRIEVAEFLDVDVDDLAGRGALVAWSRKFTSRAQGDKSESWGIHFLGEQ